MHAIWRRLIGGAVLAAVVLPVSALQPTAPDLTRQQREAMQALVNAADGAATTVPIPESDWPLHVLRASDGSHYVAFSLTRGEGLVPDRPLILYVRLATRRTNSTLSTAERSAVAEWLAGQTPVPLLPRRGIAIGEMPTYGASGISRRDPVAQTQDLQLLNLERERARERREEQERARKAALEGTETARVARPLLPFEDFDLAATTFADRSGAAVLRRSLTAGPGDYELTVAWLETGAKADTPPRVARRTLSLPPASTTALALSSVIVADEVGVRETPIPPTDQTAHPYSIGPTEIIPARDHILTPDERLALVVQVINPRAAPTGKPDVAMGFRVFRREGEREQNVGSLAPQLYNEVTLPFDFDIRKGHPIFAAVAVPLQTFKRGDYRLEITANDRVAGTGVVTDVTFTVAATPATLLRDAPPLTPAFDATRESLPPLVPVMLGAIRASEGNDHEALAAWQTALDAGADPLVVWPLMIDACLRQADTARAIDLATRGLKTTPDHRRLTRQLATALLIAEKQDQALRVLETHLQRDPADLDAQWLALHTLFAGLVAGRSPATNESARTRLLELADGYAAAGGPHATLAREWASVMR